MSDDKVIAIIIGLIACLGILAPTWTFHSKDRLEANLLEKCSGDAQCIHSLDCYYHNYKCKP